MTTQKKKIINYQDIWKLQKVKIKDLVLDINNVRLETDHESQDAIINDLFLNEDAISILESIHQIGYFPDEPPVVVKEKGKYVVLDGNRRIVSLKAMLSPSIAPSKYFHRIEKLMSDRRPIEYMSVHVATSRDKAMEYLAAKHTKTTRKAWSALRRAYFYYAQKEQGQSVEKLIGRYKGVDIPSYIKMYEMHNVALSLKSTSQEIKTKAANKRTFPITTLERFYSDSYIQDELGIEFNKITGEAKVPLGDDFDKVYSRVITDIVSGIATSRKELSKESDREKYLDSVIKEILGKDKVGQKKKKSAFAFKPSKKPSAKKKDLLVPSRVESTFDSPGIGRVLWELQHIDYRKFPNATADLLRTFLEITIKKYLEELGALPKPRKRGGYIYLNNVLTKIKEDLRASSNHRLVQVINEIEKNKWYLDSINHNPDVFAVGDRVKDAWDQVYPLIKHMFDDYQEHLSDNK
ncbi:MAG: hypothetical protein Q8P20_04865 [bacterium]|nr:hypothetical protein [bacterium]